MSEWHSRPTGTRSRQRLKARKDLAGLFLLFLFTAAACSAGPDFEEARTLDTPEAYEAYLQKHPDNKDYSPKAKKRLEALRFREAQERNTYEAYVRFVKSYRFGPYTDQAARAAEDIRAEELGISLYREQPADFYTWVDSRRLPYRILVLSSSQDMAATRHVETKWYLELVRRGLFVPMDPQKSYRVSPDLTLHVRESVIALCANPLALVDAEVRVGGVTIKTYRIAAGHIEKFLLYEIFRDQDLYDPLLRPSKESVQDVRERFEQCRGELPLKGSLALEFDLPQQAPEADQEMIREFVQFLRELPISEDFLAYPRGRPLGRLLGHRIYLSVDQELHHPRASRRYSSVGSSVDWAQWNTKQILVEREYFFKRMTLDLLDLLRAPDTHSRLFQRSPPGSG